MDYTTFKKEIRSYSSNFRAKDLVDSMTARFFDYNTASISLLDLLTDHYPIQMEELFAAQYIKLKEFFLLFPCKICKKILSERPIIFMEIVRAYIEASDDTTYKSISDLEYKKVKTDLAAIATSTSYAAFPTDSLFSSNSTCIQTRLIEPDKTFEVALSKVRYAEEIFNRYTPDASGNQEEKLLNQKWIEAEFTTWTNADPLDIKISGNVSTHLGFLLKNLQARNFSKHLFLNIYLLSRQLDDAMRVEKNLNVFYDEDYEFPHYIPQDYKGVKVFNTPEEQAKYYYFCFSGTETLTLSYNDPAAHAAKVSSITSYHSTSFLTQNCFSKTFQHIVGDTPVETQQHNALMFWKRFKGEPYYFLDMQSQEITTGVEIDSITLTNLFLGEFFIGTEWFANFETFIDHYVKESSILQEMTVNILITDSPCIHTHQSIIRKYKSYILKYIKTMNLPESDKKYLRSL